MNFKWYGITEFNKSVEIQMEISRSVREEGDSQILGFEHPPTITLGRRASFESEVNFSRSKLENQDIFVTKTDRGGMATLHSPGQLVIYPIVSLRKHSLGVRDFLGLMERTTRDTLNHIGIPTKSLKDSPGLYSKNGKIAFFGFRIDRGVSRHGISINVENDLSLFETIKSCGVKDLKLDQTKHFSTKNTKEIFSIWVEKLKNNLTPKTV